MRRLAEIDALRGLAIVMMIVFHFGFDLSFLGISDLNIDSGFWLILMRATQFLFLGLVGVSVALSSRGFVGQMKRGAFIFCIGMLISLATRVVFGEDFVKFGVLHLIGVVVPVLSLFKGRKILAFFTACMSVAIGMIFKGMVVESILLFPFGLVYSGFSSYDYFPIFPWISVCLVGLIVGEEVYGGRRPPIFSTFSKVPGLCNLGKHSLFIYLIHQPIIYFSLLLFRTVLS